MKKALSCCLAAAFLFLSLAGCSPTGNPSSDSSSSTSSSSVLGLSAEETAIANAATTEELNSLMKQYYQGKKYDAAMLAAVKILKLDPSDQGAYNMKAELYILMMKDANDALISMIEQDIGKVSDQAAYKDMILKSYEGAGFHLSFPFIPDYSSKDEINTVGSNAQNLFTGIWKPDVWEFWKGVFATQGDWIYYFNYNDNFSLYKMRLNGDSSQKICDDAVSCINVVGDWIYYSNANEKNALYKIRTDGSERARLSEDNCEYVCVSGDVIYYCNGNENGKLYRMGTDGSGREAFGEDAQYIFIDNGYLYYSSRDERTLSRISLDTRDKKVLINGQWNVRAQIIGSWIYFLTDINGLIIAKMPVDGGALTEVWRYSGKINSFIVAQDHLIVSVRNGEKMESMLAFNLQTMEQVLVLDNTSTEALCIASNGDVVFSDNMDNNAWFRVDWENGIKQKIG